MLVFFLLIALSLAPLPSVAEECDGKTCIDVSADENKEVVITVRKNSPGSHGTKKPQPGPSAKPAVKKPWIPWLPKAPTTYRPKPRKSPSPKVKTQKISATSVMDQVRSVLPKGVIITQPGSGALVREPVYFRTTVPTRFSAVIIVLEIPIQINLTAKYFWNFGDGGTLLTTEPGAPYPLSTISHTYKSADSYPVSLQVQWQGTWRSGPLAAPIRGEISQVFSTRLKVDHANFRITG